MGGGDEYNKIIKICNSVCTTFSVSFESSRITRQETGWCSFGSGWCSLGRPLHGVFHDLSLYDIFSKLCVPKWTVP